VVRARCAWARLPSFGLKFIDAEAIEESADPNHSLKQAWKAFCDPSPPAP
jgi:hypothetical protein